MALNTFNYAALPLEKEGLGIENLIDNFLKGYRAANNPSGEKQKLSDFALALNDRNRIKASYGEESQEAKLADAFLNRKANGPAGMQLTVDPATGAVTFSSGGTAGGGGSHPQIVDGKYITPPTQGSISGQQESSLAEHGRQHLATIEHKYLGKDSNALLIGDYNNYFKEKDPKKKKALGNDLVDAYVANMLVPEYAGYQLNSQGIRTTEKNLEHQIKVIKQGWPASLPFVVDNLPIELQKEGKKRHAGELAKVKKDKDKYFTQGFPIELDNSNNSSNYGDDVTREQNNRQVIEESFRQEGGKSRWQKHRVDY